MKTTTKTWVFYGESQDGIKTIHFIKQCKKPPATKEYKKMLSLLSNNTYHTVGNMTSTRWNEENQYIKIAQ